MSSYTIIIGASLSEPHTSVTALRDACRCLVAQPTTYRIFKLNERIRFCARAKALQNSSFNIQ